MHSKKIMKVFLIILSFILIQINSCREPDVIFGEPQPNLYAPLLSFQPIYRGVFLCDSDSSMVHVHAQTVFKEKTFQTKLALSEVTEDDNLSYSNGFLLIESEEQFIQADERNDSIYFEVTLKDTLFQIGKNHILKFFRGHHILNKKISKNEWEVEVLSLVGQLDLRYAKAALPDDLQELKEITPIQKTDGATEQIMIRPTILELSEILDYELIFNECDYFIRQDLPNSI